MATKKEIQEVIKKAERSKGVKILWAIESGSRAWKFASKDSDYDIRCMHIQPLENYLGINKNKEQINYYEGDYDLESWDIRKFLRLSIESNTQIAEWLRSPIIYRNSSELSYFRKIFDKSCDLEYLRKHYLSMAKSNYMKYINLGKRNSCKKWLYVLRAIGCAEHIKKEKKLPSLPYYEVIKYLPKHVKDFFEKCIKNKLETEEAKIEPEQKIIKYVLKKIDNKKPKTSEFKEREKLENYVVKRILKESKRN